MQERRPHVLSPLNRRKILSKIILFLNYCLIDLDIWSNWKDTLNADLSGRCVWNRMSLYTQNDPRSPHSPDGWITLWFLNWSWGMALVTFSKVRIHRFLGLWVKWHSLAPSPSVKHFYLKVVAIPKFPTEIRLTSLWELFGTERGDLGQIHSRNHRSSQTLQTAVVQCPSPKSHSLWD